MNRSLVVALLMFAMAFPVAADPLEPPPPMQRKVFDEDPTLPRPDLWDFAVYYHIQSSGAIYEEKYGSFDHTIECTGGWMTTVSHETVPTEEFIQAYFHDYALLRVKILYEDNGLRETHDYVCSSGQAGVIDRAIEQEPASSCGTLFRESVYELYKSYEGRAAGDSEPSEHGVADLSPYSDLCIVFVPASGAEAVDFTGRLELTARSTTGSSWYSTWPNLFADQTPPRVATLFSSPQTQGGSLGDLVTIQIRAIPLHTGSETSLPEIGLGGVGDWRLDLYGMREP